jgi:hypothetical protein
MSFPLASHTDLNSRAVPTPNPQCSTAVNHLITNAVFNISSDVLMLALGVPMFIRIQIPLSKKIPLLGIFVIIAAVLNKWYSFTEPFGNAWTYWYVRESATAIIVANLPFVWLLYRRIFGIRTNSVTGSKTKSGHNTISLRSRAKSEFQSRTPRTFLDRRGSFSSEVVTSEESRWERCFDDKAASDSSGTRHLGLFEGHRPHESDGRPIHCMETAVLHDKKSAGSFV